MSARSEPQPIVGPLEEVRHAPADCALLVAVPADRAGFERAAKAPDRDFVARLMEANRGRTAASVWSDYARIADYTVELAREARKAGATTIMDASFACWKLALPGRPVVVLFAHCRPGEPDAIEFADGIYPVQEVARAVPPDCTAVLDFAVCYSLQLYKMIKQVAPRCTVIVNKQETPLDFRLALVRQAMRLLATGKYSYPGAMTEARLALIRGGRQR